MDIRKRKDTDGSERINSPEDLRAGEGRHHGGGTDPGRDPEHPVEGADLTGGRTPSAGEGDPSMVTDIPGGARRADGPGRLDRDRREPAWSWEGEGSRYRLEGRRPSLVIIVGWDRPLATYFLQVWDVPAGAEDHEEGELLLWGGTAWGELRGIGDLAHALAPFAALPRGLAARLLAERMASPAGGSR